MPPPMHLPVHYLHRIETIMHARMPLLALLCSHFVLASGFSFATAPAPTQLTRYALPAPTQLTTPHAHACERKCRVPHSSATCELCSCGGRPA